MAVLGLFVAAGNAVAHGGIEAQVLANGSTGWDGSAIRYLPGDAEAPIAKVRVAHGAVVTLHRHPVPLAAYVAKDTIEVEEPWGSKQTLGEVRCLSRP